MKNLLIVIVTLFIGFTSFAQKKKDLISEVAKLKKQTTELQAQLTEMKQAKELNLQDSLQSFSYSFGVSIGNNLKTIGFDSISYNAFAIALEDVMNGTEKKELEACQREVQTTIQMLQDKEAQEQSAEGEKFLAENGKKPNIVTTESGLQYEILTEGSGTIPKVTDKVKVHYTGTLLDGAVFDSSVERGEPISFAVTGVIKGWTEALQLMTVGSKWKLFIPQDLAYGPRGAGGGQIPPYAALIFEVELLDIEN